MSAGSEVDPDVDSVSGDEVTAFVHSAENNIKKMTEKQNSVCKMYFIESIPVPLQTIPRINIKNPERTILIFYANILYINKRIKRILSLSFTVCKKHIMYLLHPCRIPTLLCR